MSDKPRCKDTIDEFVAWCPVHDRAGFAVFRRQHAGKTYARIRIWHRHRENDFWYPGRRALTVAIESAADLGDALAAATRDRQRDPMPAWMQKREDIRIRIWPDSPTHFPRKASMSKLHSQPLSCESTAIPEACQELKITL